VRGAIVSIAVISDTHLPRGERRLPDECLQELERADLVLHCGDFVAVGVLEELTRLAPVEAVQGNMDEPKLKAALPEERIVEVEDVRIGMVHVAGRRTGREERLVARFPSCEVIVYGHTHVPDVTRHGGVWILNPGSPTDRRRAQTRAMIVLDLQHGRLEPRLVDLRT
jgi:putative phosphoesterase